MCSLLMFCVLVLSELVSSVLGLIAVKSFDFVIFVAKYLV